jgi:hypothetical protein
VSESKVTRYVQANKDTEKGVVRESSFGFEESVFEQGSEGGYFDGYWQSPKYFTSVKNELRREFTPRTPMSNASSKLLDRISVDGSICLNVRRGDYARNSKTRAFHGLLPKSYFYEALERAKAEVDGEVVYVFSDEPEWCKDQLLLSGEINYVEHSHAGPEFTHYLTLMAAASAFVIPNSTFAWWAAWLSGVPGNRIVAPRAWFADPSIDTCDLFPHHWQRI